MSNPEDEEDEEEECFYESLDRHLSTPSTLSSSSSSSCSDDDDDDDEHGQQIPKFPMSLNTYEVWISEPSSIEERRKRLLREMGLSSDPSLSRLKTATRSASSDTKEEKNGSDSCGIVRSKSDTASSPRPVTAHHDCNCLVSSSSTSTSFHSIHSIQTGSFVNNQSHLSKSLSNGSTGSPTAGGGGGGGGGGHTSSPNKPPTGKPVRRADEIRPDSFTTNPNPNHNPNSVNSANAELEEDLDCNEVTIKNLDNGEEFVVNEIREDGMWNKVREVGTGRQLTMEEFEMSVGHSPIVQELMRRQNVEQLNGKKDELDSNEDNSHSGGMKSKKKGSWLKSLKNVAVTMTGHRERRSSDERDTSSEKGGRRSSSATDDSQDVSFHGPERVRVRQYGKSCKEVTALYKCQEIQAHNGSIWCIKFSLDGRYLASAGEDCVIHVWQVGESERKGELLIEKPEDVISNLYFGVNGSPDLALIPSSVDNHLEKKRRGRTSISRKSISLDHIAVPETVFALSEKPFCSFRGHLNDVLDLSWSKSQYLLSSSMDKTVRLWHMASNSCLKVFSHSDYVTCIQFNPVDDGYFISGSLDAKVRIWSIPDRQVVDWNDLHEMVTAACYMPDGQGALVGSYKGSCCLYNTTENKLHQKSQINLQNKKKKSHLKKITGFQFAPGSSSEVLITSADSRIRVIDGVDLVHKFKGFRNTSSQISASLTANGKYVICASGDSYVYIWNHENDSRPNRNKGVTVTGSYEHFHCQDVSVAIPWPGIGGTDGVQDINGYSSSLQEGVSPVHNSPLQEANGHNVSPSVYGGTTSPLRGVLSSANSSYFYDRISATWPEEKLLAATRNISPRNSVDFSNELKQGRSAWGMVIVTAGLRGEIKIFQNFGLPVRL